MHYLELGLSPLFFVILCYSGLSVITKRKDCLVSLVVMSAILGHYTRTGVKVLSKLIPSISGHLSSESIKYFDRTFILASDNINFESKIDPQCSLTIRQVNYPIITSLNFLDN